MACIPLLPKGILLIFHTTRRYKRFFVNYRLSVDNIDNNVRSGVANHLCAYESVILVVIPWPANTLQNNAPVRTWTVRHYSTYIVIFLKRHNGLINGNRKIIFTHRLLVSLTWFTFWWWHQFCWYCEILVDSRDVATHVIQVQPPFSHTCYHKNLIHHDVIKWKHFPRYWSFVRGIHRSPVDSPYKGQWRGTLMFFLSAAEQTVE